MGGGVRLINGHIDNVDRCVCCGRVIPEGSQYCVICGQKPKQKQRQIDRIRKMSVEELEKFLCGIYDDETCRYDKIIDGIRVPNYDEGGIKQWLESEVDTE